MSNVNDVTKALVKAFRAQQTPSSKKKKGTKRQNPANASANPGSETRIMLRAPGGRPSGVRLGQPAVGLYQEVCGQYDPFCTSALGRRLTDEFRIPTLVTQGRIVLPVSTGAGAWNAVGFSFWPSVDQYAYDVQNAAASYTVPTGPTALVSNVWTTISTGNQRGARLVSAGLHWIPTLPLTGAGGFVEFAEHGPHTQDSAIISNYNMYSNFPDVKTFDIRKEFVWYSKPMNRMFKEFLAPVTGTNPVAGVQNQTFSNCTMTFSGPPSTNLGYLELVLNYEYLPAASSVQTITNAATTEESVGPPGVADAALRKLRDAGALVFDSSVQTATRFAERAVHMAVAGALQGAARRGRGPARAALAQ